MGKFVVLKIWPISSITEGNLFSYISNAWSWCYSIFVFYNIKLPAIGLSVCMFVNSLWNSFFLRTSLISYENFLLAVKFHIYWISSILICENMSQKWKLHLEISNSFLIISSIFLHFYRIVYYLFHNSLKPCMTRIITWKEEPSC